VTLFVAIRWEGPLSPSARRHRPATTHVAYNEEPLRTLGTFGEAVTLCGLLPGLEDPAGRRPPVGHWLKDPRATVSCTTCRRELAHMQFRRSRNLRRYEARTWDDPEVADEQATYVSEYVEEEIWP